MPFIWPAMFFNVNAFLLFHIPKTRENYVTLNIGCVLIFIVVTSEINKFNDTDSFLAGAAYFH